MASKKKNTNSSPAATRMDKHERMRQEAAKANGVNSREAELTAHQFTRLRGLNGLENAVLTYAMSLPEEQTALNFAMSQRLSMGSWLRILESMRNAKAR